KRQNPTNARSVRNRGGKSFGRTHEVDASRIEEESGLSRRRRRLALAARRQVHRHRRALQPAARSLADRVRRGQGEGLARQGCAALGGREQATQDQEPREVVAELLEYLPRQLVAAPDAVRVGGVDGAEPVLLALLAAQADLA